MSSPPELRLNWCSHEAAKYAVEKWHYSKSLPAGKSVKIGTWENGVFVGVVYFSCGANPHLSSPYGLLKTEACELTRVALGNHKAAVSRILKIALLFLKRHCPLLRLVVSYADDGQGHHGGIYQAGGWLFVGTHSGERAIVVGNKKIHPRTAYALYGTTRPQGSSVVAASAKHKYLMPLDDDMRKQIEKLRKPYPKRVGSADSGTPLNQSGRDGANPIPTLHTIEGCSHGS